MKKKKISDQQVAFIKSELKHGDAKSQKTALQNLSSLYRNGGYISQDRLGDIESEIVSRLLIIGQDKKVVRWGLNALAQCGRWATCQVYIETAISRYSGDPEIEAAGVAALCKMLTNHTRDIDVLNKIDPKIWKLAALQTCDATRIDLQDIYVDISKDDKEILKLALIIIGVNRDISHLFHPKHSNGTFVRELCTHDDPIVQQYSVWAVTENAQLDLQHLGLRFDAIPNLRPNVQAKMYQLAAQRLPDLRQRLDLISLGSCEHSIEAREGLAKGVRHSYFEGLETAILPWLEQETTPAIRGSLVEHISEFSDECGPYLDKALQAYDEEEGLRSRILLGAEGKPLYGQLKSQKGPDLFSQLGEEGDLAQALRNAKKASTMPKKTVCMLLASPRGTEPLRLDQEVRDALQKLKNVETPTVQIDLRLALAAKQSEIMDHLLNSRPQIIHFSGHGGGGMIFFEDEIGTSSPVTADGLAAIVDALGSVECVVLNACNSSDLATATKAHVKFVIGCNDTINDDAAVTFTRSFYRTLAHGRDYSESYKVAIADVRLQHGADEADKYNIYK